MRVPMKFQGPYIRSVEEYHLAEGSPFALNCFPDQVGGLNRRPGLTSWKTLPTSGAATIRGKYWWSSKQILVVVADDQVYALSSKTGEFTNVTGTVLPGSSRPVFAATDTWLFIAAGAGMLRWNGTGTTVAETSDAAPLAVSALAEVDGIIVANNVGTKEFAFAETDDITVPPVWESGYLTKGGKPDPVTVMMVGWRELFVGGEQSLEVWQNTGAASVFERIAYIEKGILAPASAITIGQSMMWLGSDRRVYILDNRTPEPVSSDIDTEIFKMPDVTDAVGTQVVWNGRSWYVLHFPTANRTFALDLTTKVWIEWTYWDPDTRAHGRTIGELYGHLPQWSMSVATSRVYEESPRVFLVGGYGDDGDDIRWIWRSAHLDHGTDSEKTCADLAVSIVRGENPDPDADAGKCLVRWRSNGKEWEPYQEIDLGLMGDRTRPSYLYRMGAYDSRQYEIQITDQVPVSIRSISEDLEGLEPQQ